MDIRQQAWGTSDGRDVSLWTLDGGDGLSLAVTNFGAIIQALHVPDSRGRVEDVVLGFDRLEGYQGKHPYFGAICGRVANRIAHGRFTLGGKTYQLATNDHDRHHLHGGTKGFDKHVWDASPMDDGLQLTLVSEDGDEGYPGRLTTTVRYRLARPRTLRIEMTAVADADADTIVNLAQHTYWNLAGHGGGDVCGHEVQIFADRYTPADAELITTGQIALVHGTPMDFRKPKPVGRDLAATGGKPVGYDHNFIVNGETHELRPVARVHEPTTGRTLELDADRPAVQLYTGNFLDGSDKGKGGVAYRQHAGLCLETQDFPDAINKPDWPSIVLRAGQTYEHNMVVRFSA